MRSLCDLDGQTYLRVFLEQISTRSGLVPGDDPRFFQVAYICLGGGGAKRPVQFLLAVDHIIVKET